MQWPRVIVETRPWLTNPNLRGANGARPGQADRTLTEIRVEIPAMISDVPVTISPETHALCEQAAAEIVRLETRSEHLAGVGDILVRSEAVASSKIERVYADLDDVARASVGVDAGDNARSTFAASLAIARLASSCDNNKPLSEQSVLEAHRDLMADDLLEKQWAGRYRQQQNWIGGSDFTPLGALHVPPPQDIVKELMADLMRFANRNDTSAVAQAAIVHAQFEAIHPFTDGNGRVGRALIGAALRRSKLTRSAQVPIAAAMLADVDTYFFRLKDYRNGNVDALVSYVAQSAVTASAAARVTSSRLAELPERWRDTVKARRGSSAISIIDRLVQEPVLDIARAQNLTHSTRVRTYEALDRLVEHGVLTEITGRSRNRVWVAGDVMSEVRDLEERIGQRTRPSARWH